MPTMPRRLAPDCTHTRAWSRRTTHPAAPAFGSRSARQMHDLLEKRLPVLIGRLRAYMNTRRPQSIARRETTYGWSNAVTGFASQAHSGKCALGGLSTSDSEHVEAERECRRSKHVVM